MSLRRRALLFGFPALELLTLWLLAQWIGWGLALLAFLGGVPIGLALMGSAGKSALEGLRRASAHGLTQGPTVTQGARFACGLCLAIPGVWSDLVGLALLVPAAQRFLLARYERSGMAVAWSTSRTGVTVIRGDVLHPDDRSGASGRDGGPAAPAPADQRGGAWSAGAIEGHASAADEA